MGSDDVRLAPSGDGVTPKQFAEWCKRVQDCREASYTFVDEGDKYGHYGLSYRQAAEIVLPSSPWAELIAVLLFPEYADVWEWVNKVSEE